MTFRPSARERAVGSACAPSSRARASVFRRTGAVLGSLVALGSLMAACSAAPRTDPLGRYVAVHNTLSAMGLVQQGPVQRGSLGEGKDTKLTVDLPVGCTTLVALGGEGVQDVDVELSDSSGKARGKDTTTDREAVVRVCVEEAGKYTLSVKMRKGAGEFLAATWSGDDRGRAPATAGSSSVLTAGSGTCDNPAPLGPGISTGTTAHGEANFEGTCGTSSAKEIVYRLEVPTRQRVSIEVDPRFDAVLYVRKECSEPESEVACNDDVQTRTSGRAAMRPSRIDEVLDAGTYYVFVDGYEEAEGNFRITVNAREVPSLAQACQRALPLVPGSQVTGSTQTSFDHAHAKCGDDAKGSDVLYRLDVAQKSRVRITEHADFSPVVHVRKRCAEAETEVGCSSDSLESEDAAFVAVLEPGQYSVFADSTAPDKSGRFTLHAEVGPEQGTGTSGDTCGDAAPISSIQNATIDGDTFVARDDVAAKCGGSGGADLVYRVDVPRRSRLRVRMIGQEGSHVFALARNCTDAASQIACGSTLDEVVQPGTYYLVVDAKDASSFGKFRFELRSGEVGPQETACKNPPELRAGQTLSGTTINAGDKFTTSCGGPAQGQSSPDRMYKIVLAQRSRVKLELTTPTWDGVLAIRRSCLDQGGRTPEVPQGCNNDSVDEHHAKLEQTLDAGTYFVHVDGHQSGNQGAFTLLYTVGPATR